MPYWILPRCDDEFRIWRLQYRGLPLYLCGYGRAWLSLELAWRSALPKPWLLFGRSISPYPRGYSQAFPQVAHRTWTLLNRSCPGCCTTLWSNGRRFVSSNAYKIWVADWTGTITAHHLYLTGDMSHEDPLAFCKPIPKTESDMHALLKVAASGDSKFFL